MSAFAALFQPTLLGFILAGAGFSSLAQAAPTAPVRARATEASAALIAGEPERAIDALERLADEGAVHPDVSFNRGLAYLRRAESPLAKSGDLGQAAAGFAESLALSPHDTEAGWGLEEARLRVARRNAHAQGQAVIDTEPLGERLLALVSTRWAFAVAALGSLILTFGLLVGGSQKSTLRLSASVSVLVGLLLLLPAAALAWAQHAQVLHGTPAIVVAERASLLDSAGRPLGKATALPEGQSVQVREFQGRLARIVTTGDDVWVLGSALRIVPRFADP